MTKALALAVAIAAATSAAASAEPLNISRHQPRDAAISMQAALPRPSTTSFWSEPTRTLSSGITTQGVVVHQNSVSNAVEIVQEAAAPRAHVTQTGQSNTALVLQLGAVTNAHVAQRGMSNVSLIGQIGTTNIAIVRQQGLANASLIVQAGQINAAIASQIQARMLHHSGAPPAR